MSELYYVVSLKHTNAGEPYICFWRAENKGYALPLSWAGKYKPEQIRDFISYYNNGETTLTVRCEVVDVLGVAPKPGLIDGDTGPAVPNTRESWDAILAALIDKPMADPAPRIARSLKLTRR